MKRLRSFFTAIYLAGLLSVLLCMPSFAAKDYTPSRVTTLTAKAGESSVTLKWKKASKATGYNVYMKIGEDGTYKRIVSTKKTSYTKSGLTPGKMYYFRIRSVCSTGSQKYYSTSYSKTVKAKPTIKATAAPTGFKSYKTANNTVYFSWNKAKNATGYLIYRYDSNTKKYVQAAKTTSKTASVSGLTNGKSYKFKIRSYRTIRGVTRYGAYSSAITVKTQKQSAAVASIHPMWYKATVRSTITASPANSKSKKQTVKKGTKVTVISYGSVCKVRLLNNDEVYIRYANLNITSTIYTKTSYSRSVKEDYVNQSGYTSKTKYLIWVSTYTQEYCLYTGSKGKWKLLRTAKVATGKAATPTASRICKITRREPRWTYENGTYQAPIVYFHYENAFHSRLHNPDGSLAGQAIGKPVSGGCIRMYDEDIQYLYDNVPDETTVVIY